MKKNRLFITVFITIYWVKPAWPVEPILFTSALLMGALPVTPTEPASCQYFTSANFFYLQNTYLEIRALNYLQWF